MRDINRIQIFLDDFSHYWSLCPDLRFGQLISNIFNYIEAKYNIDPFFVEDDEMGEYIKEYFEYVLNNYF